MLRLMLLPLLLLLSAQIVVGEGDVDGTTTAISLLGKDGKQQALCTVEHRKGFHPKGTTARGQILLTLAQETEEQARSAAAVVALDPKTCKQRVLLDEAIVQQAPLFLETEGLVVAVSEHGAGVGGALFDVLAVPLSGGPAEVLAERPALWVTPARGAKSLASLYFLVGDGAGPTDGEWHIDRVSDGLFQSWTSLGPGVFRSPVVLEKNVLFEQSTDHKHAELRNRYDKVYVSGLAGLSPVVNANDDWAASSGKKDGSVEVNWDTWPGPRAGIARPQLLLPSLDDGVVAFVDRGASLPGELWLITKEKTKSRLLLPPKERTAVVVYGVLP